MWLQSKLNWGLSNSVSIDTLNIVSNNSFPLNFNFDLTKICHRNIRQRMYYKKDRCLYTIYQHTLIYWWTCWNQSTLSEFNWWWQNPKCTWTRNWLKLTILQNTHLQHLPYISPCRSLVSKQLENFTTLHPWISIQWRRTMGEIYSQRGQTSWWDWRCFRVQ